MKMNALHRCAATIGLIRDARIGRPRTGADGVIPDHQEALIPRALSVACALLAGLLSAAPAAGAAEVKQVRDGAVYATGTLVTGPCQVGEDFPDQGSPHQRVHTINDETHINAVRPYRILGGDYEAWPIAADSGCRPLRLKAGLYEADLFHEEIVREWCNVIIADGREVCGPDDDPYGEWAWLALSDTNRDRHVRFRAAAKLNAKAGGPDPVTRGQVVTLDGSRSTPKRAITAYRWTYKLGEDCPKEGRIADNAGSDRAKVSFTALCSVRATLTVTDGKGREDSDETVVRVRRRTGARWRIDPGFAIETDEYPAVANFHQPRRLLNAGELLCASTWQTDVFCPAKKPLPGGDRWKLAQVPNARGPFDDWYYVEEPHVELDQIAFLNPYMEPRGEKPEGAQDNWYHHNRKNGIPVARYRAETIRHEGRGSGRPRSGHMQALVEGVRANDRHNDPRRYLETQVSPSRRALAARAHACIKQIDNAINAYAEDPLNAAKPALPKLYFWNDTRWTAGSMQPFKVGGRGSVPNVECVDKR